MTPAQSQVAIRTLVEAALPTLPTLPPGQRADAYEGIEVACRDLAPDLADAAKATASTIREAESAQLHFQALLTPENEAPNQ